jgi:hypothetical protein
MRYNVVVVPALETMRKTTLDILKKFKEDGGRVIFMGECPDYIECISSPELRAFYDECEHIPFDRNAIVSALDSERRFEIRGADGALISNYIYQMRIDGKYKWLFVANGKKGPVYSNMHSPENPDVPNPVASRFRIRGEYTPVLYDTVRGEIKRIPYTV